MKFTLNILEKRGDDGERRWPSYIFGGRLRTSTFVLIVAFLALWWTYDTYRPEPAPKPPAPQVVPPGFVPDPNYTWVPRSRLQQPPATVTITPTPTTTMPTTTVPSPAPTTTTAPPPFVLPTPPCLLPPPFCPPSPSPATPPPPPPQPGPAPAAPPPAG
ncbi:hypothetical protein H7H82_19230 [Mycobacterium heidelbergense]|uniref:Uncharacterized protein n=1 Tax=Mycobacterium heidelbergense TaxID=53376 RepID=A0A1X0DPS7_MYCHE|nr:hypothetical protein [Mycobacterium heidelbergense]MCV7052700.1 hypothetical protein [Mycobacterium heidelbergense]ORA74411.1 hypothetical protein BST25_10260 [Mycobacterium heidelbergense]BBZ48978.1 hypothetical protein MHEI_06950 [Mycobacterium heidelbergense]